MFYAFEGISMGIVVTNTLQFGIWRCMARKSENECEPLSHWRRWDGVYYLAVALPLNMMFPIAVIVVYIGQYNMPASKMWHSGSWFPNSGHGIALYAAKWIGFVFLTVGMLNVTEIHIRIMKKWRSLRSPEIFETSDTPPWMFPDASIEPRTTPV